MTTPQAAPGRAPRIVDVDVHVADTPDALAPYAAMPWRKSLEILGRMPYRHLDMPAFSPGLKIDVPVPGGQPRLNVKNPKQMRDELDAIGVTAAILVPDNLLHFGVVANIDYAVATMEAYNRWLEAEWLQEDNGLWGALMAGPQDPVATAREIEKYTGHPRIKAIFLPTAGVNPLWGNRKYEPIMKAAEASGMPLILHSVTLISPAFPMNQDQFENQYARQILTHPFSMMANLVGFMHTGVPVRYPKLKFVFTEACISWVPHVMWRLDRYQQEFRRLVPFFEEDPSAYMKRQMWFATQPLEEPEDPKHLVEQIHQCGGAERIMFASDWPHHDFDHPRALNRLPLTPDERRKIMSENAVGAFDLPPLPARIKESQSA
jgi:predicted TIM-barrel fold metal-dependent hydrolase